MVKMFLSAGIDLVMPRVCHLCGCRLADAEKFLCVRCRAELPRTHYHRLDPNPMEEKLAGGIPFVHATALYYYTHGSGVAQLIQDFKYRGFPSLAYEAGRWMGEELSMTHLLCGVDVVQPVPMHFTKRWRRGYNQTELLARGIADFTGLSVGDHLAATRIHMTQTRLDPEQRERNMRGYFRVKDPEGLRGAHVLIIDDVCTTGATLRHAASPLEGIEGLRVSYATLAAAF